MSATLRPGLVSVTFRKLSPELIVELVARAGLSAIEWGGDIHVPHGDVARAEAVRKMTADAGLVVSAYGSYYRCAAPPEKTPAWQAVQETALALGAPAVRVWAGIMGSASATDDDRRRVADNLCAICQQAAGVGLTVDLEYHSNTLTDTLPSALALLKEVNAPNLRSFWQPRHGIDTETSSADIRALAPWLSNVHVFHWWPTPADRRSLADGMDRWRTFFATLRADGKPHFTSLEFVRGDEPAQFLEDAATLRQLLSQEEPPSA